MIKSLGIALSALSCGSQQLSENIFSLSAPSAAKSGPWILNISAFKFPWVRQCSRGGLFSGFSGTLSWHELSETESCPVQFFQAHRFPP